jgi:hypothetical protein
LPVGLARTASRDVRRPFPRRPRRGAEARLSEAVAQAIARQGVPSAVRRCCGGVSVLGRPQSPINKVIGMGFTAFDAAALEAVEAEWSRWGEPVRAEVSTLVQPEWFAALAERGYRLAGFENLLVQPLAGMAAMAVAPGIVVTPAAGTRVAGGRGRELRRAGRQQHAPRRHQPGGADHGDRRHGGGRGLPALRRHHRRPARWRASLRIDDRIAFLSGAATLPPRRQRGVQRELRARLATAAAAGCEIAAVTTEPGSQSQRNAMAHGFELAYSRAVLIRPMA